MATEIVLVTCNSGNSFDDCQPDYDLHWLGVTFPSSFFLEDSDCSIRPLFSCRVPLVIILRSGTMRYMLSSWMLPVHGISVRIGMLTIDNKLMYIDVDLERLMYIDIDFFF
jgi:hypothetical protein